MRLPWAAPHRCRLWRSLQPLLATDGHCGVSSSFLFFLTDSTLFSHRFHRFHRFFLVFFLTDSTDFTDDSWCFFSQIPQISQMLHRGPDGNVMLQNVAHLWLSVLVCGTKHLFLRLCCRCSLLCRAFRCDCSGRPSYRPACPDGAFFAAYPARPPISFGRSRVLGGRFSGGGIPHNG